MADLSDVEDGLCTLVGAALYPPGVPSDGSVPSIAGVPVRIFPGWPTTDRLDCDLTAGIGNVSVFPRPQERNTTRYLDKWQSLGTNVKLLFLTIDGQTVTVSGQIPPAANPHHVMVAVNGAGYAYLVQPTDSLADIAAALAALIAVAVPGTTNAGAMITLPPSAVIDAARVGITQTSVNEVRRQERLFQIAIWANSPQMRKAIAVPVDLALAKTRRFVLPDQSVARVIYHNTVESDQAQKQQLYRRDLLYTVEYPTLDTDVLTEITQLGISVSAEPAGVPPPRPVLDITI